MKKLSFFIIFFIAISILFFSCNQSTGISLTKRHYRNGYNLEVSGKPSYTKIQKAEVPEVEVAENKSLEQPVYASIQSSDGNYIKHEPLSFTDNTSNADKGEIVINSDRKAHGNKPLSKAISKAVSSVKMISKTPFSLKRIIAENKTEVQDEVRSGGGWIWTIIAVLLVLWLLSLLTGGWGLGGLLYLFLVVALVLILLRLLRVI